MTKQSPNGRYKVFSTDDYRDYPNVTPAGRYDQLQDAIQHAESVTYRMAVVDAKEESLGFIYCNWESDTQLPKYRIERSIPGGFRDSLLKLWEGDELPTFAGRTPYLFDDKATAERVAWRLAAKYSETMATPHFPAKPITYSVVPVASSTCPYCGGACRSDEDHACDGYLGDIDGLVDDDQPKIVPKGWESVEA